MLHIKLIAVGKLKERFWADACAEYFKRMKPYVTLEVVELADVDPARVGGEQQAIQAESETILSVMHSSDERQLSILLDIDGKLFSSEDIALTLETAALEGTNNIVFVIGGSCGVSQAVREASDIRCSLGKITLPHNLARVVLLEQLYRAFKILRREPYHK